MLLPPVVTSAVEVAGLAATAAADCPSAASCASTDSSGSHRMPSVAVEEAPPAVGVLPKAVEEAADGMNVPRSRKMADGLALVRLWNSIRGSVGRCRLSADPTVVVVLTLRSVASLFLCVRSKSTVSNFHPNLLAGRGETKRPPYSRCLQVNCAAVTFRKRRLARQKDGDVIQFLCVGNLGCEPAGRFG